MYDFRLRYRLIKLILLTASEAILTSKFKSELSLVASMNFRSVNCASKILEHVSASVRGDRCVNCSVNAVVEINVFDLVS